ncbi:MAG: hypothetical protein Kow00109_18540 [Acidobacteriota bacterium]
MTGDDDMKVDLEELQKEIESQLELLENRRRILLKRQEAIKHVLEIVEETLSESDDFRIQNAIKRISQQAEAADNAETEEIDEDLQEEPPIRLAFNT